MPFFMIKTYIKERAPKPSTLMVMGLQKPGVKPQRPTSCHDLHYSTWCVVLCVRTRIPVELGIKLLKASMEISEEISYWNLSLKTISLSLTSPWSWSNVIHPWWSDLCLQAIHCSLPSPPRIQPAFQRHCSELKHDEEKKKKRKEILPKLYKQAINLPIYQVSDFLVWESGSSFWPLPRPPLAVIPGNPHLLPRMKALGLLTALWSGNAQLRQSILESG